MHAEVKGTTMPVLEVQLQQGESIVSTHGELSWMHGSVQMSEPRTPAGAAVASCAVSSACWAAAGCS